MPMFQQRGGYGFMPAYSGMMGAFGGGAQNARAAGDRQIDDLLQMAKIENQIYEQQQAAKAAETAKQQNIMKALDQWELRNELPKNLQNLYDVDPNTAIARGFPEPSKPGDRYRTVGSDLYDISGDKPAIAARGRRNDEPLQQVYDPDTGKVTWVPRSQAAGGMVPPKQGITIGADGSIQIGGSPDIQVGKKNRDALEGKVIEGLDSLALFDQIDQAYNSDFLTYQGAAKAQGLALYEKSGGNLSPENQQYLQGYTSLVQSAGENLAMYVKGISGAAVSDSERKTLGENVPDPKKDSPTQFSTKFQNKYNQIVSVVARSNYLKNHGIPSGEGFAKYPLGEIPILLQRRGDQIEQEALAAGVPPEQIPMAVAKLLEREFGISPRTGMIGQ